MLAKSVPEIPTGAGMTYEPKWDGFRCLIFRDGSEVELVSRGNRPMSRYFPDVIEQVRAQFPARCVVDGELVVIRRDPGTLPKLDFELLQQRIHPAASRVKLLADRTPAEFIAYDLLALGDDSLMDQPYAVRRERLAATLAHVTPPVHRTPVTADPATAARWFEIFEGAGLDGVVAKPPDIPYAPGKRLMFKIKHARTADCVVAGFRWLKGAAGRGAKPHAGGGTQSGPVVGSLLLGLYAEDGGLRHVGVSASFTAARRVELLDELAPYRMESLAGHPWAGWAEPPANQAGAYRMPGAVSRWSAGKTLEWQPLRPELVVEVGYESMEGDRFRNPARFVRWRPDRDPRSCDYTQLERPIRFDVDRVLDGTQ
jgi:ATP-dependent DNA ligase